MSLTIGQAVRVVATGDEGRVFGLAEWASPRQPTVAVKFPRPGPFERVAWYDPGDLEPV